MTAPKRRKRLVVALSIVLAVCVLFGLVVTLGQRYLIYFPDQSNPGPVAGLVAGGKDVEFTTEDGLTLHTWLVAPTAGDKHVAVLFLPGNAGNRAGRLPGATAMADLGYTVLMLEYRGYGGNPGHPSEEGLAKDARAAVAYLRGMGFAADHTLYAGESLGTGVAVRLATTDPPAGVLLRSPFTSLVDVAKNLYPWLPVAALLRDRFDTLTYLPQVTVPITVLAGSADTLVPVSQSTTVADDAPNLFQFTVLDGVGHNDGVWLGPYLAQQVDKLAAAAVPR